MIKLFLVLAVLCHMLGLLVFFIAAICAIKYACFMMNRLTAVDQPKPADSTNASVAQALPELAKAKVSKYFEIIKNEPEVKSLLIKAIGFVILSGCFEVLAVVLFMSAKN